VSELLTADGIGRFSEAGAGHVGDAPVPGLIALVARGDPEIEAAERPLTDAFLACVRAITCDDDSPGR